MRNSGLEKAESKQRRQNSEKGKINGRRSGEPALLVPAHSTNRPMEKGNQPMYVDWNEELKDHPHRGELLELIKEQRHERWLDIRGGMYQTPQRLGRSARVYPRAPVADEGGVGCWWDRIARTSEPTVSPHTGVAAGDPDQPRIEGRYRQAGPTDLWPPRAGSPDDEKLEQVVDALPPDLQECFHLLYGEGLKVAVAARRADCSTRTMFTRRSRLQDAIREAFARFAQ